ncbi:MAG TPA: ankyrin repeat domain-containing protein [Bryobacteraceae bacterium]|jgi:ankyrin repeat protein|nr:ankyrin repeat domain-containing protein [Bryobacteraceae bacterium]
MSVGRFIAGCAVVAMLLLTGGVSAVVSEVADAAMNKNISAVRSLLQRKADVNAPQVDGATALHWAARLDDLDMADLLIEAGANVKAVNRFDVTPLSLACINGSAAMIEKLLKAGADPNGALSELGETPIMMAARTGNVEALQVLLDHGANVNAHETSRGDTALIWAASEGHAAAVKLLIEHGADVNARSIAELPPAGGRGGGGAAKTAQKKGQAPVAGRAAPLACPPSGGPLRLPPVFGVAGGTIRTKATGGGCISALILAARQNHPETVRVLLDAGADINLTMADGTSALVVAIINAHFGLAKLLLDRGADPNIVDGNGMGALYGAVDMRNVMTTDVPQAKPDTMDPLDLIKEILDHGANVNARLTGKLPYRGGTNPTWQSEVGATPFLRAAYSTDIVVMRLLLANGADPGITASDKTTPLMAAAGVGWLPSLVYTRNENLLEVLKLCVELGNDVNAVNDGKPNSGGPSGLTALHGAAFKGLPEGVQFLVDNGAKVDARDTGSTDGGARGEGRTPLEWAEGVYFEGQPPRREEKTEALLRKLMSASAAKDQRPTR